MKITSDAIAAKNKLFRKMIKYSTYALIPGIVIFVIGLFFYKTASVSIPLLTVGMIIVLAAFFCNMLYPWLYKKLLERNIKRSGEYTLVRIVGAEAEYHYRTETDYKLSFKIKGSKMRGFCYVTISKKETIRLGEVWAACYDKTCGYVVLLEKQQKKQKPAEQNQKDVPESLNEIEEGDAFPQDDAAPLEAGSMQAREIADGEENGNQ